MPAGYCIVVANSLVTAARTRGVLDRYNRRAVECRLAAAVLSRRFSDRCGRALPLELLGDLKPEKLGIPQSEVNELADETLSRDAYTLEDLTVMLKLRPREVTLTRCRRRDGTLLPEPEEGAGTAFELDA